LLVVKLIKLSLKKVILSSLRDSPPTLVNLDVRLGINSKLKSKILKACWQRLV